MVGEDFRSKEELLFKLADRHQNCLLIDLAIQHAWRASRREARARVGSAYFGVFHELMADHFMSLCQRLIGGRVVLIIRPRRAS